MFYDDGNHNGVDSADLAHLSVQNLITRRDGFKGRGVVLVFAIALNIKHDSSFVSAPVG